MINQRWKYGRPMWIWQYGMIRMRVLGMPGFFQVFLAEPFFAAAVGTANIAVCRNVDENCWVIRDVAACIVSIGMAVYHKNVFAAAFGANVGIFMGGLIPFYGIL